MKRGTNVNWLVAVISAVVLAGCSRGPSRLVAPEVSSKAGEIAVGKYDTDKDGRLNAQEISESPALNSAMARIDKDGDSLITAAEIDGRVNEWRDSRIALTSVMVTVRMDGRPLPDAVVSFVPESLMGDKTETPKGTTDSRGMVRLRISDAPEGRGVRPGLYNIRVSKKKDGQETLPKKYSEGTDLGIEVVTNIFDSRNPILNLTSR
ncbi:MAG: hypothetical protein WD468_05240 [Pirellulales bacterium]